MNPRCLVLWTSVNLRSGVIFFAMISGLTSVCDLARGKDVFTIMATGLGKSLTKAALTLENSTTIVVSRLISIMRDQVEQFKKLGLSAAAIGIGEEGEEDEKKAREGKCEIVFGSPESWLITKWQ